MYVTCLQKQQKTNKPNLVLKGLKKCLFFDLFYISTLKTSYLQFCIFYFPWNISISIFTSSQPRKKREKERGKNPIFFKWRKNLVQEGMFFQCLMFSLQLPQHKFNTFFRSANAANMQPFMLFFFLLCRCVRSSIFLIRAWPED